MGNESVYREMSKNFACASEEEQSAVAMGLSTKVLVKELYERITFSEMKNTNIEAIAKERRVYGKAIEKVDAQGKGTVNKLASELVGMGKG